LEPLLIRLILASASPRRRELLTQAGFAFTVEPAEVDETPLAGEAADAYVERLAREKAQAVCRRQRGDADLATILAADTTVVLPDGTILGKPADAADAARMLRRLSGRTHSVMTGIAAVSTANPELVLSAVETTRVTFAVIPDSGIDGYVASSEPLDKAGAYAIQGYAARWIPRIEGDYFNVVGLPIARTVALLEALENR
jgi:septum formation protein